MAKPQNNSHPLRLQFSTVFQTCAVVRTSEEQPVIITGQGALTIMSTSCGDSLLVVKRMAPHATTIVLPMTAVKSIVVDPEIVKEAVNENNN